MLRYLSLLMIGAFCFLPFLSPSDADQIFAQGKKGKNDPKLKEPPATPAATLKVAKDFKVELLYSVPKDEQGSLVICVRGS